MAALPQVVPPESALYYSVWAPYANTAEGEAGAEHPVSGRHLCDSMQLIATFHRKHGRLTEAEGAFKQVLELKQKMCAERPEPPLHSELADTLNDLGLVHLKQGGERLPDAEKAFQQALEIRIDPSRTAFQRKYGGPSRPPDPDTAVAYNNLALVHLKQRRLDEAEAGFTQALEQARKDANYLGAPLELANITRNLATVHQMQGRRLLALEGFECAELCMAAYHEAVRTSAAAAAAENERLARR